MNRHRDLPDEMGVRRVKPDARGNWEPLSAFEGHHPGDKPEYSSWWLVLAGAALLFVVFLFGG